MIIRKTQIKKVKRDLSLQLPLVFSETVFKRKLHKILLKYRITDEKKTTDLSKIIEKVQLKWNTKVDYKLLTFDSSKIQIIDILAAFPATIFTLVTFQLYIYMN